MCGQLFWRAALSSLHPDEHLRGDKLPGGFVDVHGAAKILNVSVSYLNKARIYGAGPRFSKFGHLVRYSVPGLYEWARSSERASTSDAYPKVEKSGPPEASRSARHCNGDD